MEQNLQPALFDYSGVDSEKQARLQVLARQGRDHLRRTREEILAFGDVLLEAKSLLPHGQFRSWAASEFGIPDSTITYAMRKAKDGDIELENVNINILSERAESKHHKEGWEALEPLARVFCLDILALGQILSDVKIRFLQKGYMQKWAAWCSHAEMDTELAGLFIMVFETYMMHPDKTPQQIFQSLVHPIEVCVGHLLLKETKGDTEKVEAICFYADWLHGMALLRDGRVTDIPLDQQQAMLEEAEEGLKHATRKVYA